MPEQSPVVWENLPTLPLAETLDPEILIANGALLERCKDSPFNRFGLAWNTLELGLATGNQDYLDTALHSFHKLTEHPLFDLSIPAFVDARTALAYEPLLRNRPNPDAPSRKGMSKTYRAIGGLLDEMIETNNLGDYGKCCELIVDGVLLRIRDSALLPQPSSVREEKCLDGTSSSHDRYLLRPGATPKKYPLAITKNQHATNLSPDRKVRQSLHPNVTTIPVLQIAVGAISKEAPELRQEAERADKEQDPRLAILKYVAQLIIKDSTGDHITQPQTRTLHEMGLLVKGRSVGRHTNYTARGRARLTHKGLAAGLFAAGFGETTSHEN